MEKNKHIAIIGGGPSGLMAAEKLATRHHVTIYDRMPNPGRKLLMAGRGGLNLTHSEAMEPFITRYGSAAKWIAPVIKDFTPEVLRQWCEGLGQETFVGSSGRIFPRALKAAPLLRAWLNRLDTAGVRFAPRHTWQGWRGEALRFTDASGADVLITPDATLLALGGASWPRLGSDGSWVKLLADNGVAITPLQPANCGFTVAWSDYFRERFAGQPLKPVKLTHEGVSLQGEAMITAHGIEGGAIYAFSTALRDAINKKSATSLELDLRPAMTVAELTQKLDAPRGSQSLSSFLRKCGFSPLAVALLREVTPADEIAKSTPAMLAVRLKSLPLTLTGTTGIARSISTAGGIQHSALDTGFMLKAKPGVFAAGEMLDWEAPTGGYLLQGCFSTAVAAAKGIAHYLE